MKNVYLIGVKEDAFALALDSTADFMRVKDNLKEYMISSTLSILELMDKSGIYKIVTL